MTARQILLIIPIDSLRRRERPVAPAKKRRQGGA
jgi:hypothetical protein